MKVTEEQLGILTNLSEECAEVQQVVCKIIRFGWDSYHPDDPDKTPNIIRLANEIGNLLHMVDIVDVPEDEIMVGVQMKKEGIKKHGMILTDEKDEDLERAWAECQAYIETGALDEGMIADIAHDHDITAIALTRRIGWD